MLTQHFDVEFDMRCGRGAERITRSSQCKLLEVITGSAAANDDLIPDYLHVQALNFSASSLDNPMFDRLFALS